MTDAIIWPWQTLEPGIYFNQPFDVYCEQKCLNASGIKNILVSPTDYWARSWMNPLLNEVDEETKAKEEGRAYHTRILEGKALFYSMYAPAFEDDVSDTSILRTNKDMENFIKQHDGKGYSGKVAAQLASMCLDIDPNAKILEIIKQDYYKEYPEMQFLAARTIREIELAAKMIEHHPELQTFFAGGYPEVTVVWDDPEFGVRFKIRLDYVKIKPVCDLKSFANLMKKEIGKAINYAVASQKYHIQAWLYLRGVNIAKGFVKEGRVFGAENIDPEWLKSFAENPAEEFWYVFQQKGIAPVSRGAKWSIKDEKFNAMGRACIAQAADLFRTSYAQFGEDAWVDKTTSTFLTFDELPAFIGDV